MNPPQNSASENQPVHMRITGNRFIRFTLSALGAILLGGLSSGAWEYGMKPALIFLRNSVLNLSTLWITNYKDAAYQTIALGFHENASIQVLGQVMLHVVFILLVCSLGSYLIAVKLRELKNKGVESVDEQVDALDLDMPLKGRIGIGGWQKIAYLNFVMGLFLASAYIIGHTRTMYVYKAVGHFSNLLKVCGPYLATDEERMIISKFSQVRTREDYVRVTNKLESIAQSHGLIVPTFKPW